MYRKSLYGTDDVSIHFLSSSDMTIHIETNGSTYHCYFLGKVQCPQIDN